MPSSATLKFALCTALVLALSGATVAFGGGSGQTVKLDTQIKIRDSFPAFHGRVKSENAACTEQRRVKLFKQRRNGGRKLLGVTQTGSDAKWFIEVDPLSSGAYFAVAQRREEGTAGTIFVCLRDRSRFVAVD